MPKKTSRSATSWRSPFPSLSRAATGKDNAVFEFYSAPAFDGDAVFLVHFRDLEAAQAHYASVAAEWQERKMRFKKESMDNIFRGKGWKVR